MEPILLGVAASSVASEMGNLVDRTCHTAAKPFAAVLHAVASALDQGGQPDKLEVRSADPERHLDRLSTALGERLEWLLNTAGVELKEPISFQRSMSDGSLVVVGDHPQKAIIESAIADDTDLSNQLEELALLAQFAMAAESLEPARNIDSDTVDLESVVVTLTATSEGPKLQFNSHFIHEKPMAEVSLASF